MATGATTERASRLWWVVTDEGRVKEAIGVYDGIAPESTKAHWHFPSLGITAKEGAYVFNTRFEAVNAALSKLNAERNRIDQRIKELLDG